MSEQIRTPEQVERRAGIVAVTSTIGILLFLAALLAYCYPEFLPPPPELAVREFIRARQGETWYQVREMMVEHSMGLKSEYAAVASKVDLVGYEVTDSVLKRIGWALGGAGESVSLRVTHYYRVPNGKLLRVPLTYKLERYRGDWAIDAESALDGGAEQFLRKRGALDA